MQQNKFKGDNNPWNSRRKKGRLIIRNLPFKVTEDILTNHFSSYGEISDINILRRADGKLVGCGFIEFKNRENAKDAIEGTSGKPLLDRPIIVDWALPKGTFKKSLKIKEEPVEIKQEVKEEPDDSDDDIEVKSEEEDNDDDDDDEEEESDEEMEDDDDEEEEIEIKPKQEKKQRSNDIKEGRTIFIKNIPFTSTNDELRSLMLKFGPMDYALICVDPITEHSKGSAFVKFKKKESADVCLQSKDLTLGVNKLEIYPALDKQQLANQMDTNKDKKRDGRNLYLIKEGVILAGSSAAEGVSVPDMSKRLQLEQWKTQILRNLSMFVSRYRLVVHNIPPNLDDNALRKIFKKHSPPNSKIHEARVMRDLRKVDKSCSGVSKEYGFVSFNRHEDALAALRAINNNPNIFTSKKRPIVGFSIENKNAIQAKQKRLDVSRKKNPYFDSGDNNKNADKKNKNKETSPRKNHKNESKNFAGMEAHPGQTIKLPNRIPVKSQMSMHRANSKKNKKNKLDLNAQKRKHSDQKMSGKGKKQKLNDIKEEKSFNLMFNKYKNQIEKESNVKKWYE